MLHLQGGGARPSYVSVVSERSSARGDLSMQEERAHRIFLSLNPHELVEARVEFTKGS